MESSNNEVTYSFKEKYFLLEPEKRIRRRQFFTRSFVPGILIGLLMLPVIGMLVGMLIPVIISMMPKDHDTAMGSFMLLGLVAGTIPTLIYYIVFLLFIPKQIIKRAHDFGSTGKWETRIFVGSFILFLLSVGLILCSLFTDTISSLNILLTMREIPRYIIIILYLYLLFRPGNPEANEFGENPKNVKLGFLG